MGSGTSCAGGRRMGRPIIGITGELEAARWRTWIREAVVSPVSYTRAVERAGGTLIQHLPDRIGNDSHKPDPVKLTTHDVQISPTSKLAQILGTTAQVP